MGARIDLASKLPFTSQPRKLIPGYDPCCIVFCAYRLIAVMRSRPSR